MSNVIQFNPEKTLTMTSREIAELVKSRHADVCRTIERLIEKGVIRGCAPTAYTHEQNGQQYTEYHLDKRSSLIVVAQLCPEFTAAIVDRWQQLEEQISRPAVLLPNFNDPAIAARAWADEVEQKRAALDQAQKATQQLAIAAPKAEALDRIAAGDENVTITQAAKVLGIKRELLTQWMHANGWVYRQNGSWVAYDAQIRPMPPSMAEALFLRRYWELTDVRALEVAA